MARPLRINYPGAIYHITCRGNERRDIFSDDGDRWPFRSAWPAASRPIKLHGYVLVDNHFHLSPAMCQFNVA